MWVPQLGPGFSRGNLVQAKPRKTEEGRRRAGGGPRGAKMEMTEETQKRRSRERRKRRWQMGGKEGEGGRGGKGCLYCLHFSFPWLLLQRTRTLNQLQT